MTSSRPTGPRAKPISTIFLKGFMEDSYVNGKIYSIPFQRSTMVLFYNKDAFAEVGLNPDKAPTSWKELVEYSQKLVKKDAAGNFERYGCRHRAQFRFRPVGLHRFCPAEFRRRSQPDERGRQEGLLRHSRECGSPCSSGSIFRINTTSCRKGIVQWTDLPGQFLGGKVAMIYHTTGNLTNINKNATFKFGTAFLPGSKRIGAPTGGGNFYITSGIAPARQKAAWKFIKFATSAERLAQWNLDTGYVAPPEGFFRHQADEGLLGAVAAGEGRLRADPLRETRADDL